VRYYRWRDRQGSQRKQYERPFIFREIRYFDLEGQVTGIKSRAMTSPCGKIRIPINEEGQEKAGQIQEPRRLRGLTTRRQA
jgi:4-hydroxyphenylpyruvate dioxygenase